MLQFKNVCRILVLILFVIPLINNAQENSKQIPQMNITMFANEDGFTQLEKKVFNMFVSELGKNGLYSKDNYELEYLIDVKPVEIDGVEKIILSITTLYVVPEEVVKLNAKEEAFYTFASDKKLPVNDEARKIRQYVSGEYIKQFRMIQDNYLDIVELKFLNDYVSEFLRARK